jgi:hypothetical protein
VPIDQGALIAFLVAVPLAICAAVGFGVAICRGTRKERRARGVS